MSPITAVLSTALERTADLIEKGTSPAKALRQEVRDLEEYEKSHSSERIPDRRFTHELGAKRAA